MIHEYKFKAGAKLVLVKIEEINTRLVINSPYNKNIVDEVKVMEGAKWHGYEEPPRKVWSIKNNARNWFQIKYLAGENPYKPYEIPLIPATSKRKVYPHQLEMKAHCLTRKRCVLACEMGTGKTLVAIEVMEESGYTDWWYVGPKSACMAVSYELKKWGSKIQPQMFTYEALTKAVDSKQKPPQGIIFDECSRAKNPSAKRSIACREITDLMRANGDPYIIMMSGTPAPKSPVDWWNICEIACPGFLREGDHHKFKKRLALIAEKKSAAGGVYPEIVTWLNDEKKCNICGQYADHWNHPKIGDDDTHDFKPSVNEVDKLYRRMQGLVIVKQKKDCLSLPEKVYRVVQCKPSLEMERLSNLIIRRSKRAVEILIKTRELSDGFQYDEEVVGKEECPECKGRKVTLGHIEGKGMTAVPCDYCKETGVADRIQRIARRIFTPKDEALKDLLDEHEDRVVIFAGFTDSIDKIIDICHTEGWFTIRFDGRGPLVQDPLGNVLKNDPIAYFQGNDESKIAFVGHPATAGMGLTLTASPSIIYYSNDFNAESRIQSEDRIHRPGCTGANIIDIVNLGIDMKIIENLKNKRNLMAMTLGELSLSNSENKHETVDG